MKLTIDEKEDLVNLVQSSQWEALKKVMTIIHQAKVQQVLQFDLKDGAEALMIEKARGEGSSWFMAQTVRFMEKELLKTGEETKEEEAPAKKPVKKGAKK